MWTMCRGGSLSPNTPISARLAQPRGPRSAWKAAPTTSVGMTNGTTVRAWSRLRPRKLEARQQVGAGKPNEERQKRRQAGLQERETEDVPLDTRAERFDERRCQIDTARQAETQDLPHRQGVEQRQVDERRRPQRGGAGSRMPRRASRSLNAGRPRARR